MFRVGQKVVRVGSAPDADIGAELAKRMGYSFPKVGDVVIIKTLNVWPTKTILTFHEHDNSHIQKLMDARWEPGFDARAFRPLVARQTDISIFTRMLKPKTRRVQERA